MTKQGKIIMAIGLLLLAAALCLTAYNLWSDAMASMAAEVRLEALRPEIPTVEAQSGAQDAVQPIRETALEEIPDYLLNPQMDMPVKTVDGTDYIGILQIPALALELPVISTWSYPNLRLAPCRYAGSAYQHNLVISGHNYSGHFRDLKKLQPGDAVTFTDTDGNIFSYTVLELETLSPSAVEEMTSGDWDLTLFTCTVGGQNRIAVRCEAEDALPARYAGE